jgi:hypothetical protein
MESCSSGWGAWRRQEHGRRRRAVRRSVAVAPKRKLKPTPLRQAVYILLHIQRLSSGFTHEHSTADMQSALGRPLLRRCGPHLPTTWLANEFLSRCSIRSSVSAAAGRGGGDSGGGGTRRFSSGGGGRGAASFSSGGGSRRDAAEGGGGGGGRVAEAAEEYRPRSGGGRGGSGGRGGRFEGGSGRGRGGRGAGYSGGGRGSSSSSYRGPPQQRQHYSDDRGSAAAAAPQAADGGAAPGGDGDEATADGVPQATFVPRDSRVKDGPWSKLDASLVTAAQSEAMKAAASAAAALGGGEGEGAAGGLGWAASVREYVDTSSMPNHHRTCANNCMHHTTVLVPAQAPSCLASPSPSCASWCRAWATPRSAASSSTTR